MKKITIFILICFILFTGCEFGNGGSPAINNEIPEGLTIVDAISAINSIEQVTEKYAGYAVWLKETKDRITYNDLELIYEFIKYNKDEFNDDILKISFYSQGTYDQLGYGYAIGSLSLEHGELYYLGELKKDNWE